MTNTPTTIDDQDVPLRPVQNPQPVAAMSTRFKQSLMGFQERHSSKISLGFFFGVVGAIMLTPTAVNAITGWPNGTMQQNIIAGMGGLLGFTIGLLGATKINDHSEEKARQKTQPHHTPEQRMQAENRAAKTQMCASFGSVVIGLMVGYTVGYVLPSTRISYDPPQRTATPEVVRQR